MLGKADKVSELKAYILGRCKVFATTEKEAYEIVGIYRPIDLLAGWEEVRPATKEEITAECLRRLTK